MLRRGVRSLELWRHQMERLNYIRGVSSNNVIVDAYDETEYGCIPMAKEREAMLALQFQLEASDGAA